MFVPVPVGSCRAAVNAQIAELEEILKRDRDTIARQSYDQLYAGAVHNGLKPTQSDLDQMREMSNRDVDHMMEDHPAAGVVKRLNNMSAMLDYLDSADQDTAVIDHDEFSLLAKHLVKAVEGDEQAA